MGLKYLLDTNAIIDFTNGKLPAGAGKAISSHQPAFSFITRIELFAWPKLTYDDEIVLNKFSALALIIGAEESIIVRTIAIRKLYKLKVPDALIAATALGYNLILATHDVGDFKRVPGLQIVDPYSL